MVQWVVKFIVVVVLASTFCVTPACADQNPGAKNECASDEAAIKPALEKLGARDFTIVEAKKGPLDGLIEVVVVFQNSPALLYFDCSKKHLIQGRIVEIETKRSLSDVRMQELSGKIQEVVDKKRIDLSQIPLKEALLLGKKEAAKKVVVFTDPDCPFCAKLHEELKKVVDKRQDIAFYMKLYPLPMHKDAEWKAKSMICAKSLKMLEDNFAKKAVPKKECGSKEVEETIQLAQKLGITGTPAIILPDGRMRSGALPAEELIQLIDGKK